MAAELAASKTTLPPGFGVTLFAAEPNVRQPIALTFDDRGRVWVVECYSYPRWEQDGKPGRDRVVVYEDRDGDGRFDRSKVFWDKGTNLTGIELGFGGVWLCSSPNLLFVPDRDGDDRPDGPPTVVLDGWNPKGGHTVFHGLTWGPDGWLWGCNGYLSDSRVGPPGTPDRERTPMSCGVWRFHPTRGQFEVVAHGGVNPWGLDFDLFGEAFLTNCVIPHLFHVIPGAQLQRGLGVGLTPHVYEALRSCADHVHWDAAGEGWADTRERGVSPTTDRAGGGHAHSGAAIYNSDSWPAAGYANTIVMGNIHGKRLNRDRLELSGSGYVARHEPDLLLSPDPWFRTVAQRVGPDGSLYVLDWSDSGECHEDDADYVHDETGRVYRVSYGAAGRRPADLSRLDPAAVAAAVTHPNEWQSRRARRLLQERAAAGHDLSEAHALLRRVLVGDAAPDRKLRALWALAVSDGIDATGLTALLGHESEFVRAWAVRLLVDRRDVPPSAETLGRMATLALEDPSPRVRLALAAALQRIPAAQRGPVAEGLMGHAEDVRDPNLPLMVWYGVEPAVTADPARAAVWSVSSALPAVRKYVARRLVEADSGPALEALFGRLAAAENLSKEAAGDVLDGVVEGLRGRRSVPPPAGWPAASARLLALDPAGLNARIDELRLVFKDENVIRELRSVLADREGPVGPRARAIETLSRSRVPGLVPELIGCLDDMSLRGAALKGLAEYDDPAVPAAVLDRYPTFGDADRATAVHTLASRPAWALALLESVGRGVVPRKDVPVTVARQLLAFGQPDLDQALARHWGSLRSTSSEKEALAARYRSLVTATPRTAADPARGRAVFDRTCKNCHKLFGEGGDVGPELTGSDRANLDYVLLNVLDPSASVAKEYKLMNVATTDGRLVSGLVRERTESALVVRTADSVVVIPKSEVEEERPTETSMMPEGLFQNLSDREVADLVAYLSSKAQVPLPAK